MAVIGIHTEPTGRTVVLFDFRASPAGGADDVQRIEYAIEHARAGAAPASDDGAWMAVPVFDRKVSPSP